MVPYLEAYSASFWTSLYKQTTKCIQIVDNLEHLKTMDLFPKVKFV